MLPVNQNLPPDTMPVSPTLQRGTRIYIQIQSGQPVNIPVPEHGVAHYVLDPQKVAAAIRDADAQQTKQGK